MNKKESEIIEDILRESRDENPVVEKSTDSELKNNIDKANLKDKLHFMTKSLIKYKTIIFKKEADYKVNDLDVKVSSILEKSIFIRKKRKSNLIKLLPLAACLLMIVNIYISKSKRVVISEIIHYSTNFSQSNVVRGAEVIPLYILSPGGNLLSQTPEIILTGSDKETKSLRITDSNGKSHVYTTNSVAIPWKETGFQVLTRGNKYFIQLAIDNYSNKGWDIIPKQEIYVLSEKQAKYLTKKLNKTSNIYDKAQLFFNNYCFSEARNLCIQLIKKEPKSLKYLTLLKKCYEKMGLKEASTQVEKNIKLIDKK